MSAYELWRSDPYFDEATRRELAAIEGNAGEIEDRFYRELAFGTGGLRGVIGAGTNRMNRYVVRKVTAGLAAYIHSGGPAAMRRGVVIAHDSRRCSPEFALEAALTLAAAGIRSFLFAQVTPTPVLSYAVRDLGAVAGIVITASHNPPEYNGYKVYWEDGGQVPPERAEAIYREVQAIADLRTVHPADQAAAEAAGLLTWLDEALEDRYIARVRTLSVRPDVVGQVADSCRILYTPLHGAGGRPMRRALEALGFCRVDVVKEQEVPDGDFPTVTLPNPEEREAFRLALAEAARTRPDLILATDPDGDRLGVAVPDAAGEYRLLNGNQVGLLLAHYLMEQATLPENACVVKTIATSNLVRRVAADFGVTVEDVLTGFKFIGEKIAEYEARGDRTFLFGFEESYGYLAGTFVRDKDAVIAAALMAELAAFCKASGISVLDRLERLYERYGFSVEELVSFTMKGKGGLARIERIMAGLRADEDLTWLGADVAAVDDYLRGTGRAVGSGERHELTLPVSDVLHYRLPGGGYVLVRPSGTEPKIKLYFSATGSSRAEAQAAVDSLRERALARVEELGQ